MRAHSSSYRRLIVLGIGLLSAAVHITTSAHAEPWLRVRAQVSIELHTAPTPSGLRLVGTLRDDLGAALPNRELTAYFEAQGQRGPMRGRVARTDDAGRFAMPVACNAVSVCRATVEFDGDAYHERAAMSQLLESQRAELSLEFVEPQSLALSLDAPYTNVVVRAASAASGARVHVVLENELARVIATGTTDADSSLRMQVDSAQLGEPGLGELVLRGAGDATRTAARSSKPVLRTRATRTDLTARFDVPQQRLHVAVQLHTQLAVVAQRAVGVFVGERHLATLITDAQGKAEQTLLARDAELAPGPHTLLARFESDLPGLLSSHSQRVAITVEPPPRPNTAWLIAPALASLAFTMWSARRRQRRNIAAAPVAVRTPEVRLGAVVRGRAAATFALSGKVEDVDTSQGIAAVLQLLDPTGAQTAVIEVAASGEFASAAVAAGAYRVRVVSPGYEAAEFALAIPHHGTGSDLRISLRSLRVVALDTYVNVAGHVVADKTLASGTVRETLAAAMSGGRAGPSFEPLAHSVEQIAYARAVPFENDLVELQRTAATALQEIAQRSPAPQDPDLGR